MEDNVFDNVNEASEAIKRFCDDGSHPVRLESKTTIAQFNRKTKNEACKIRDLPDDEIYSVRWVCKHFGSTRVRLLRNHHSIYCSLSSS